VDFDWDEGNSGKSLQRHDVSDDEIEEAFEDPSAVRLVLGSSHGELRRELLARVDSSGRLLKIVYTMRIRGDRILFRPISAQDMDRGERARYRKR
jgi:hypothetical protein